MNGNYYKNPKFPTIEEELIEEESKPINNRSDLSLNDFLLNNLGIKGKIYTSFSTNCLDGVIEYIGQDYIIIRDIENGHWNLLYFNHINYIEFSEKVNY